MFWFNNLFKKIMLSVMQPILDSSNIKLLGFLALIIGLFLLYIVDFSWSDRIWKNTLFVFGHSLNIKRFYSYIF